MAKTLHQSGLAPSAVSVLENWSDGTRIYPIVPEQNILRRAWGLSDSFVVGYSGNLGRAHDIGTIIPVINELSHEKPNSGMPRVAFLFVGGGALRLQLEREAKRNGLSKVLLQDYQPREQLAATLSVPDVHLVILNPKLEGCIVPSKIYAIAAAGRPAIFIGDPSGEVAKIINDTKMGFVVPTGAWQELRECILQLAGNPKLKTEMGERARRKFERDWDKPIAINKWQKLLNEVMGDSIKTGIDTFPDDAPNRIVPIRSSRG
jgi:glycosyltransferase involved in cell wall biosynthesis